MGDVELFELGQISTTVRCHSCQKDLKCCGCGVCLRADEDTINRSKARFQAVVWRSNKIIIKQWTPREEHGKTTNIPRYWAGVKKLNNTEIHSCISGGLRHSRRYLDYLTTIGISHKAPYHQRGRYENTITMKSSDPNHQPGPMWKREDYRATTKALVTHFAEQGRNPIPKPLRTRQRNTMGPDFGMAQRELENVLARTDFVIFFVNVTKLVATRRSRLSKKREHQWQDPQWQDARWEDHQWHDHSWKGRKWCSSLGLSSMYDRRVCWVHPSKTFSPHIMSLLGVPTLSSFCSTPPPSWTSSPETLTGITPTSLCTPPRGLTVWPSGYTTSRHRLWAQLLHRRQQWAHADQSVQERQLQPGEWPDDHCRNLRGFFTIFLNDSKQAAASMRQQARFQRGCI